MASAATKLGLQPFSAPLGSEPPGKAPPPAWNTDQAPPPPVPPKYDPKYHGHTYRAFGAPIAFEGWTVERIRNAIALHDQGLFLESSLLALVASRFGPVFAALGQAIAPSLGLPRHVLGGQRGLSRILRDEVEAQLAPRAGLLPSPYFPPTLWGAIDLELTQMGFAVLQHVYGDPDPITGVVPLYTRLWPSWAVQYYRYRRTYVAITTEGPIDIVSGDGKFTLIGDTDEPHFNGAIRAASLEVLDGTLVKQARASYVDRYGNPKWVGIMPEKVATLSPEGDAFFDALLTIQSPNGFGALPHGSDFKTVEMSGAQSTVFKDSLDNIWQYVAAIYLGSDGTMTKGTGVYSAPIFAGVRRDIVERKLKAMIRGVNHGHVAPYLEFNYSQSIAQASGWVEPVLDIPLPDPDKDARIKSYAERRKALTDQIVADRAAGVAVTQDSVELLAERFDVEAPVLASGMVSGEEWLATQKLLAPDEIRAARGLPPLPDDVGSIDQLARERAIPAGTAPAARIELAPADMASIVRVDEARVANGLSPLGPPDGNKMVAEVGQSAAPAPAENEAAPPT